MLWNSKGLRGRSLGSKAVPQGKEISFSFLKIVKKMEEYSENRLLLMAYTSFVINIKILISLIKTCLFSDGLANSINYRTTELQSHII